jgi:hypothetical protein
MIVAIIALIMIFIFMNMSWYEMEYKHEVDALDMTREEKFVYNLNEIEYEGKIDNETMKDTVKYDENEIVKEVFQDVKEVMDYTYYFYLIAAIMLILAIVFIPIVALGKLPHVIGVVFLVLALVFVLIIPIYFYFTLPPAIETQFDKTPMGEPLNDTFKYNGEFLSSGEGTDYYDFDFDDEEEEIKYEVKWGPGLAFWMVFVPLITIVVAQAVYAAGKPDVARSARGPGPRDHRPPPPPPPPPRGRGRDYDYGERPPPPPPRKGGGGRDYDAGYDQPPPRRKRDYGPPRPMRDDDYNYVQGLESSRRDDYDYDPAPPPRPPRRRG